MSVYDEIRRMAYEYVEEGEGDAENAFGKAFDDMANDEEEDSLWRLIEDTFCPMHVINAFGWDSLYETARKEVVSDVAEYVKDQTFTINFCYEPEHEDLYGYEEIVGKDSFEGQLEDYLADGYRMFDSCK